MPTFRDVNLGNQNVKDFHPLKVIEELNLDKDFGNFLDKNNFSFVCKLHPYNESQLHSVKLDNPNFHILSGDKLAHNNTNVNEILSEVDILVTDYSSAYVDFLLLDRPIFFIVPI